jgi:hypothetical protein
MFDLKFMYVEVTRAFNKRIPFQVSQHFHFKFDRRFPSPPVLQRPIFVVLAPHWTKNFPSPFSSQE